MRPSKVSTAAEKRQQLYGRPGPRKQGHVREYVHRLSKSGMSIKEIHDLTGVQLVTIEWLLATGA